MEWTKIPKSAGWHFCLDAGDRQPKIVNIRILYIDGKHVPVRPFGSGWQEILEADGTDWGDSPILGIPPPPAAPAAKGV